MANFESRNIEGVVIKSFSSVMDGQKHRSSYNYDLKEICTKSGNPIKTIKWECPDGIEFDIMEDKKIVSDPCTFSGIKNGKYTDFVKDTDSLNGLYVANPKVPSNFHDSEFKIKLTFIFE
ncbi:MAG: hypothetical protein IKS13_07320 [Ruminococcus sp.]|nr:hypothetical protein [Ruminococcus sp.]